MINEAVRRLSERFRPERIILFGSYARGKADDKSDLDLLVICPLRKGRQKLAAEMDRVLEKFSHYGVQARALTHGKR